jgi:hypothetical protein
VRLSKASTQPWVVDVENEGDEKAWPRDGEHQSCDKDGSLGGTLGSLPLVARHE